MLRAESGRAEVNCNRSPEQHKFHCVMGLYSRLHRNMNQFSITGKDTHAVICSKASHKRGFLSCFVFYTTKQHSLLVLEMLQVQIESKVYSQRKRQRKRKRACFCPQPAMCFVSCVPESHACPSTMWCLL